MVDEGDGAGGGGGKTLCVPGLGAAQFGGFPLCEGHLVCVERAQVWSVGTVNPLGYLDTHLCTCTCVCVCVCTCVRMCGIPGAAGGDWDNLTFC